MSKYTYKIESDIIINSMSRKDIVEKIIQFLSKEGAKKISIFGSFARGEENPESDIDIIVQFSQPKGLLEIVGLEQELSELIGRKVELLTEKSISPYILEKIKSEEVIIFK